MTYTPNKKYATPYVQRPNSATLWPNENKTTELQPDMRGDLLLDRAFIKKLLDLSDTETIKVALSGWKKNLAGKDCVSLAASEPYVKAEDPDPKQSAAQEVDDEDIPF